MINLEGPLLSFVIAAVLLAALGQGINAQVFGEAGPHPTTGWREAWRRTMWMHPIVGGALLGFIDLPAPEVWGDGRVGAVVWYAAAGALALPIYGWVRRLFEKGEP